MLLAYVVIVFAAPTPDMALGEQAIGAVGGGLILVVLYWALWRVWRWLVPSRRGSPAEE